MSENNNQLKNDTQGIISIIAVAFAAIGESPFGMLLGIALMIGLGAAAQKWDGHLFDQRGCIELNEIKGKVYKVNTCSGEVELIESNDSKKDSQSK